MCLKCKEKEGYKKLGDYCVLDKCPTGMVKERMPHGEEHCKAKCPSHMVTLHNRNKDLTECRDKCKDGDHYTWV